MLKNRTELAWDTPTHVIDYDGKSLYIGRNNPTEFFIDLPTGVVLAREVDAPADPFLPDAEVRAALRCWHGGASPSVVGYPGIDFPADAITRWVASWPDEA